MYISLSQGVFSFCDFVTNSLSELILCLIVCHIWDYIFRLNEFINMILICVASISLVMHLNNFSTETVVRGGAPLPHDLIQLSHVPLS